MNRSADLFPAPSGDKQRYHNPRTVRSNKVCPEVEGTGPEVEAIQIGGGKVHNASIELTQTHGELEDMAIGLPGCNRIAASWKFVVRAISLKSKSQNYNSCR
jgi:heat shock protein HslJ